MEPYVSLVSAIIKQQESIVGPLAWAEAKKVRGLTIEDHKVRVQNSAEGKMVLESLVKQYSALFGKASVEVCKDAARTLLPKMQKEEIPSILL